MTPRGAPNPLQAEHESIRGHLADLEALALRVLDGRAGDAVEQLEATLAALRADLAEHLAREDRALERVAGTGPGSPADVAGLRRAHAEIRDVLDFCRRACGDGNHPALLAERVRDLVALLREQIRLEEPWTGGPPPRA